MNGVFVVSHGWLTLTTLVGWMTFRAGIPWPDHRQHRTDTVSGAERAGAVDAVELSDRGAARAHQGEQARLVRSVDNAFRPGALLALVAMGS